MTSQRCGRVHLPSVGATGGWPFLRSGSGVSMMELCTELRFKNHAACSHERLASVFRALSACADVMLGFEPACIATDGA